jgi:hypothetical protein
MKTVGDQQKKLLNALARSWDGDDPADTPRKAGSAGASPSRNHSRPLSFAHFALFAPFAPFAPFEDVSCFLAPRGAPAVRFARLSPPFSPPSARVCENRLLRPLRPLDQTHALFWERLCSVGSTRAFFARFNTDGAPSGLLRATCHPAGRLSLRIRCTRQSRSRLAIAQNPTYQRARLCIGHHNRRFFASSPTTSLPLGFCTYNHGLIRVEKGRARRTWHVPRICATEK